MTCNNEGCTRPQHHKGNCAFPEEAKAGSPKWLDDAHGNRDRARRSNNAERRVAGALGGRRLARSGAAPWSRTDKTTARGDIKTPLLHVEHKRTDKDSMSVKREWLDKVSAGAARADKTPALVMTFESKGHPPEDWLVVPLEVARRLLGLEVGDAA